MSAVVTLCFLAGGAWAGWALADANARLLHVAASAIAIVGLRAALLWLGV